jgi:hypothetical protein
MNQLVASAALWAAREEGRNLANGVADADEAHEREPSDDLTPREPRDASVQALDLGLARRKRMRKSGIDAKVVEALEAFKLDCEAFADELSALSKNVTSALGDVAREAREAEATLVKKNAAMAPSTAASPTPQPAKCIGQKPLASRVSPSSRRPGQVVSDEDAAPADSVATD